MSSREKRAQIVDLLLENTKKNPDNYGMYITACIVGFYFRDRPEGLSTVTQVNVYNHMHLYLTALNRDFSTPEIDKAHEIMHELGLELIEKLRAKGLLAEEDDYGFTDDEALLEKHEGDFSAWAEELNLTDDEDK